MTTQKSYTDTVATKTDMAFLSLFVFKATVITNKLFKIICVFRATSLFCSGGFSVMSIKAQTCYFTQGVHNIYR